MKLLTRLREEAKKTSSRTEAEVIDDIRLALVQGRFYNFCTFQLEYHELTEELFNDYSNKTE